MSGFVTGWIQDTFSNLASTGLKAVGGYAGDAICGIGDAVERSGQSVGNGLTKKYDVVGKKLSGVGGASKSETTNPRIKKSQAVSQRSSKPGNSMIVPISNLSKTPMVRQPKAPGGRVVFPNVSTGKVATSKPISRLTVGKKTTPVTGRTTTQSIPQHGPKIVPSKESLPRAATKSKVQAPSTHRKNQTV